MTHAPETPERLPKALPVPLPVDDLDDLLAVLLASIRVWDYPSDPLKWAAELNRLANLGNALAVVARAYNASQQPLLQLHLADQQAAETWRSARWTSHTGGASPRDTGARLALETLGWRGVLQQLAADEELTATFQDLVARFLQLRSSGQEPAGEQQP